MKIVLQKVKRSWVEVDGDIIGEIAHGYTLFVGIKKGDTKQDADQLIDKILKLRLFAEPGAETFMQQNIVEAEGGVLVVSQFTLYGDTSKGTKPSFTDAAPPQEAKSLYAYFVHQLKEKSDLRVETGEFGAEMDVEILNDGPVTLVLES